MLPKNYFFYLILFLVILQSCSSVNRNLYYAPEEHNMLKLAKKNDIKAAISSSSLTNEYVDNHSHLNVQMGFSPIKHLGVFANYLNWKNGNIYNDFQTGQSFDRETNYNTASAAVGGYYLLQTDGQKMRDDTVASLPIGFLVDAYVGAGRGRVKNTFSPSANSLLKFYKSYGQLGIHWQDEYVGLSLVHRFGQLNFFGGVLNGNSEEAALYFLHLQENQKQKFRETSFKLFMGTKEVRGYINVTIVNLNTIIPYDNTTFFYTSRLPQVESLLNVGVVLSINEISGFLKKLKN